MINTAKIPLYIVVLSLYFVIVGSILYHIMVDPVLMVLYVYGIITTTIILVLAMVGIIFSNVEWV